MTGWIFRSKCLSVARPDESKPRQQHGRREVANRQTASERPRTVSECGEDLPGRADVDIGAGLDIEQFDRAVIDDHGIALAA